jgi:MFS family permease
MSFPVGAPHRHRRLSVSTATLIAVSVTTFMLPLDYTIVSVALHDIQTSLHTGYEGLQWVVNGYTLTFAIFGVAVGTGAGLGPLLGGLVVSGLGWRWAFLLNVPVGTAMLLLTWAKVRESRESAAGRVGWAGMAVFTTGAVDETSPLT